MSLRKRFKKWRESKRDIYFSLSYGLFRPICEYIVKNTSYDKYVRRAAFEAPTRYYVSTTLLNAVVIFLSVVVLSNVAVIPTSLLRSITNLSLAVLEFTNVTALLGGTFQIVSSTIISSIQSLLSVDIESIRSSIVSLGESNQIIGIVLAPIAIIIEVLSPAFVGLSDYIDSLFANSSTGSTGRRSSQISELLDIGFGRTQIRNIIALIGAPVISISYLGYRSYWPVYVSNERGRQIDSSLSRSYTFLYALSRGGLGIYESMTELAESEDAYGQVSVAFQKIVRNANKGGESLSSSIKDAADYTPSTELKSFLNGLTNSIETGSDVDTYIKSRSERSQKQSRKKLENRIESYEFISEGYVIVFVAAPIFLLIIFIVQGFSGSINKGAAQSVPYVIAPVGGLLISGVVYIIGENSQQNLSNLKTETASKWYDIQENSQADEEYKIFTKKVSSSLNSATTTLKKPFVRMRKQPKFTLIITIPIALVVIIGSILLGLIPVQGYTQEDVDNNPNIDETKSLVDRLNESWREITIFLMYLPVMIILVPWSIIYEKNRRKRERVIKQLPQLFYSIAQSNKRGLTLQESLNSVSKSSNTKLYNKLQSKMRKSDVTKDMNAALAEFSNEIKVPRLTQSVRLLIEANKVSSNVTAVVEEIADDLENYYQLQKDRKQSGRMSVVTIFISFTIGAGIIVSMDVMFFSFISEAVSSSADGTASERPSSVGIELPEQFLRRVFSHTLLILGLFSGLVAGMMENGRPANGFKYSIILSTLSLGSYLIIPAIV